MQKFSEGTSSDLNSYPIFNLGTKGLPYGQNSFFIYSLLHGKGLGGRRPLFNGKPIITLN